MPYTITHKCIDCHRCKSICPTGAIAKNEQQYQIDSGRCNDCVGYYSVPQCWAVCPTDGGCIPRMATLPQSHKAKPANDYWEQWFEIYNSLVSGIKTNELSDYWPSWFDNYSQTLSQQLQTPTSVAVNS